MNNIEIFFSYFSERGAYMLPLTSVVILIIYLIFGRLLKKVLTLQKQRSLFYIVVSSLLVSIYIFNTGFVGNYVYVTEIPLFVLSGITALYLLYLPYVFVKKKFKQEP